MLPINKMERHTGRKKKYSGNIACLLVLLPLLASGKGGQSGAKTNAAAEWPMVGRDAGGTRYSALNQITPANVASLKVAWVYHMKPAANADAIHAGIVSSGLHQSEDQPLVIGQTMYVVTPYSRVVALDSATGEEKWVFEIPDGDQASLRGA
jgi:quinoprotein glucose dehydrogenase